LVLSVFKNKIASAELLATMGFDASWVETVPQATLDKFVEGSEIKSTEEVFFRGSLFVSI
jgi:hypothetical protein